MDVDRKLSLVRMTYAAVLAETTARLASLGALPAVEATKRAEQLAKGRDKAMFLGIGTPEQAFTSTAEVFDCADWQIEPLEGGFRAEASRCTLCALAKRLGKASPCRLYCLDPLEGMVRGLCPAATFAVEQTLFDSSRCSVRVQLAG
jgi:hypothetical protein